MSTGDSPTAVDQEMQPTNAPYLSLVHPNQADEPSSAEYQDIVLPESQYEIIDVATRK